MKSRRWWTYTWASVKLAVRLVWLALVTVVEFVMFPVLWPFWLLKRAHRKAHQREE